MTSEEKLRGYLKVAAVDLHGARSRVQELEDQAHEPIAIVGMSCRYPGGVGSPQELWELLASGRDAISEFPADRGWDLEGLYDPDPDHPGTSYTRHGGFLYDAAQFDAEFFGISPREALAMDPQQRLLLEASWEALEDAGIDPLSLKGAQAGVFAGLMYHDYGAGLGEVPENLAGYLGTGVSGSVLSGRIAYTFGLEGPAVTVDTACSSSLVTIHLACQALRGGECDLALAGGVTVLATPGVFIGFSRQRALSADGRCKSFAEAADGTGWSEGVGMLLLERLSEARRNGHQILGLVRGSAINQDGASNGLTAPNGPSQQRVIAQALASAHLRPQQVDAVEGHGTGTTLGDPIEAQALLAGYGQGRERPLWLGSIKSNIGHTQAAAGVAGVIKMLLAMRHGVLPASLHLESPSSMVDWSAGQIELLKDAVPWQSNGEPRRAGVSSFGISGTNAHVILEEPPAVEQAPADSPTEEQPPAPILDGAIPWVLSGKSEPALQAQAERLARFVGQEQSRAQDVGCSLLSRSPFEHRAVLLGEDRESLLEALGKLARGEEAPELVAGRAVAGAEGAVFMFPGQGSQWEGMALELLDRSPLFAEQMRRCADALAPHVDWSLEDVLRAAHGAPGLDRVDVVQPALFAVMVSLAECWHACGVRPSAVVGHSQGEIAAAYVAGGLSLEDAAQVVALRSRALLRLAGKGGMVSVALPAAELGAVIERWPDRLALAAINGPSSVVLSGDPDALQELLAHCEAEGIRARSIPVDYASHSAQVQEIREELLAACASITPRSGDVSFYSTVSGGLLDTAELNAEYWYRGLRETVQLEGVTRQLLSEGRRAFIELSPHPVLTIGVQETVDELLGDPGQALVIGSLRRDQGGPRQLLHALAEAWIGGVAVDWGALFAGSDAQRVALPSYAFQRERFWLQSTGAVGDMSSAGQSAADHPLLGAAIALAEDRGLLLTGRISLATHPWLSDHAVMGSVLLPGMAFLELALHAGARVGCETLTELVLEAPLVLAEHDAVVLQLSVGELDESAQRPLAIYSRPADGEEQDWTRHASGLLSASPQSQNGAAAALAEEAALLAQSWPPPGAEPVAIDDLYEHLAEQGFEYGPAFQGLRAVWRRGQEIFAEVALADEEREQAGAFGLHPALLDSVFHAALAGDDQTVGPRLPFSFQAAQLHGAGAGSLRACLSPAENDALSLVAVDEAGVLVASISSMAGREISAEQLAAAGARQGESLFGLDWVELALPAQPFAGEPALLAQADSALERALTAAGQPVTVHRDLQALAETLEQGAPAPPLVLVELAEEQVAGDLPERARQLAHRALSLLQGWLGAESLADSRLVILTHGAVAVRPGEQLPGLASSPLWGLVRSAQAENPGRFTLIDLNGQSSSLDALPAALGSDEPQLAIREGELLVARLARVGSGDVLAPPADASGWRLQAGAGGTIEHLSLVAAPELMKPLGEGEIRVGVRTGGLNFRDVLIALDIYPDEAATVGGEGAGIVLELGPGVEGLAVGDRVMGLLNGLGPISVADHRLVARMPEGWTFAQGASVTIAFLTAYYGLIDLASLKDDERVLIHAGTGGVGMAAVQLARHVGAEVFATASPQKWPALRSLGLEEGHIASSRTVEFKQSFLSETGGQGVDVVLDSLAGEFVDASLELLPEGGRFVEMGKTDIRDGDEVAEGHPGVTYRAFDLIEAGPERIQEMLGELVELFQSGALEPLPIRAWDIHRAPEAFRFMSQARHTGKIVLSLPSALDPQSTVLITGGTGVLGGLLARHLVSEHEIAHLLLLSRRGIEAPGAKELQAELQELGAEVTIAAGDAAEREQLAQLLESIPERYPLRAVVHAAGVLDDGVLESLSAERLDRVLAPKLDGALNLHELTKDSELQAFVLFSSAAGTLGSPGQANYAAANAFLDALAAQRCGQGLPATSMAWGLWEELSEMTGGLSEVDRSRMQRSGIGAISSQHGLELFDEALGAGEALVLPIALDLAVLRAQARMGVLPSMLDGLVRVPRRRSAGQAGSLAQRLAATPEPEREALVLELVRGQVATVLGHASGEAIPEQRAFKELGFDSLAAVELRNRLNAATGLRLPATLVFDYPTPLALAGYLLGEVSGKQPSSASAVITVAAVGEPIAIVGMSCRYPGGVGSPQELWELLASGRDAISEFPADRGWDLEGLYDPDPDHPGTSYTRHGGFLYDAAQFDAEFFGISPREALAMDPQQRLLLEASWEALEDAGIDPLSLKGAQAGVFAGIISTEYGLGSVCSAPAELEGYRLTGGTGSVASGRIAYTFGLEGPAVSVDTACSSSLVTIHLACQALRGGECDLALAGGVTVLGSPAGFIEFSRQRGLAVDGRCKSYAEAADGTGFSEGVGMLLLERLSEARRNGHQILGLVRGSAINQDGASNGLTAPNGPSQQRVIAQALASAHLRPQQVDAVEGHGTGTTLGDPIEAQALLAGYGQGRERPLWLGSIKSNIGHTQAAAGVAGVIKMLLAMRHGVLPASLHLESPSSMVDWSAGQIELLKDAVPWQSNGEPRRAGVSSFGISGTNAHVILEEPPAVEQAPADSPTEEQPPAPILDGAIPWVLSGKSEPALQAQAERLARFVGQEQSRAQDVGCSLLSRSPFEHRAVLLGEDRESLLEALGKLARGEEAPELVAGRAVAGAEGAVFMFTGQGSQHVGMGRELYDCFAPYRQALDELCEGLDQHLPRPLREVLFAAEGSPEAELLDQTLFTQAALFALEVALFRLLGSWGVRADFLIGHSIGELAAAHVAGVFSLEDACKLVAARGRLMGALPEGGAMVSLQAAEQEVLQTLEGLEGKVSLAAVNGPASVVISGDRQEVLDLAGVWQERGRKTKQLRVSHAFHSPRMDPMLEQFAELAGTISFSPPQIPIVSNVTGQPLSPERICSAQYWVEHVREPVRFMEGMRWLAAQGTHSFLELGPDGVLTAMGHECLAEEDEQPSLITALREGRPETKQLLHALAEAWIGGVAVDWGALFAGSDAQRVALPSYAFQRERFWPSDVCQPYPSAPRPGHAGHDHPILSSAMELADGAGWLFTGSLSLQDPAWVAEHIVLGLPVLPGATWVELASHAGEHIGCELLEDLVMEAPLVLAEQESVEVQVSVDEPDGFGRRQVRIHSRRYHGDDSDTQSPGAWTRNASGVLAVRDVVSEEREALLDRASQLGGPSWPPEGAVEVDREEFYRQMEQFGLVYGPAFLCIHALWRRGEDVFAELSLTDRERAQASRFGVHPALLDAALQGSAATLGEQGEDGSWLRLPFSFSGVELSAAGEPDLRVHLSPEGTDEMSVVLADSSGTLLGSIRSLILRAISREQLVKARGGYRESLFRLQWIPAPSAASAQPFAGEPALLAQADSALERALTAAGQPVTVHRDLQALAETLEQGAPAPPLVLVELAEEQVAGDLPERARQLAHRALSLLQGWLGAESLADSRLVILTHGAVAVRPGEQLPGLASSPLWGLVRSAQAENPGRFTLIDLNGQSSSLDALPAALGSDEPQLAIREGELLVARLARVGSSDLTSSAQDDRPARDPDGTVLITGGTGHLGGILARHLVAEDGVKHLLLVSRTGPGAEGASELAAELTELGAEVTIAACDVANREQLESLLDSLDGAYPLTDVVHTAGVLEDGLIESMTDASVDQVLRPKLDAAVHLHELTEDMELSAFVLFSSATGTFGAQGQGNYAAANAFLDALAAHRRARGLVGTAMAWGLWEQSGGMSSELAETDMSRLLRSGVGVLSASEGVRLFDAARGIEDALVLPIRLDLGTLRAQAESEALPPLLRGLIRPSSRRTSDTAGSLVRRLAGVPVANHESFMLEAVRGQVATVLGHASGEAIPEQRAFKELGFDSLAAVELRNRLNAATGLRLPATLVFDYPTPLALAGYLLGEISGKQPSSASAVITVAAVGEPIAIVGMSCRYPGGVGSPQELWELLASGRDAISEFPADRGWDLEGLYDPDPDHPGTSYTRHGGFLYDAAQFDAEFFGISPREALAMDPQQRLLLEASWEALEDAGIDPLSLKGAQAGVFAGLMYHDYGAGIQGSLYESLEGYLGMGAAGSVLSGRIAYNFGLEGPAVTVDTACSSSLVTIHLACQALRGGECDLALAGGVTVMASPWTYVGFSRQRGLAPDGRCKSFSDSADGVSWSEGVGMLLLERLSEARRNGHQILGLVRGSAINQDGASNGLTAPNGPSQQRVIAQALASARLRPQQVDAVEGHGTGTTLGDPIEAQALLAGYGQGRERPLWLGSIKSNIGHTQAAAGVAGVIKMLLAMRHGVLPASLHLESPSSMVDWSAGQIELLKDAVPWQSNGEPRRAGVSSFGISGTNAHVILEEPPAVEQAPADSPTEEQPPAPILDGAIPWVLSGKSEPALQAQAERLARFVGQEQSRAQDVGCSLLSRSPFEHRAVLLGEDRESLLEALGKLARGEEAPELVAGRAVAGAEGAVFMFTGQGSQHVGMGRELYDCFAPYRQALDELCEGLDQHLPRPLREVLFAAEGSPEAELLDQTLFTQAALFALEVALFRLLGSWGVRADFLIGHSIGELAAAHVAGVFSLEDACKLVAARGRLMGALPEGGAMVSLQAAEQEVLQTLEGLEGKVSLAAVNGPASVVISGDRQEVLDLAGVWQERGRKTKQLRVSHAFHSPRMDPMLEQFAELAGTISFSPPQIPIVSNVTGQPLSPERICSAQYWVEHVREPVRFMEGMRWLAAQGTHSFLELGPDGVLTAMGHECLAEEDEQPSLITALREGRPETKQLLHALAEAWIGGVAVDWGALFAGSDAQRVALPSYAFQRERFWLQSTGAVGDMSSAGQSAADHPLLGAAIALAEDRGLLLTGRISLATHPWLSDHAVMGSVLLPGMAFLELALHAGARVGCETLTELVLEAPLVLAEHDAVVLQLSVGELDESAQRPLAIYSRPADGEEQDWTRHASGLLSASPQSQNGAAAALAEEAALLAQSWPPPGAEPVAIDDLYEHLAEQGFEYGPAFQGLRAVWRRGQEIFAEVALADEEREQAGAFGLHPALLDSVFHAALAGDDQTVGPRLPFSFQAAQLHGAGAGSLRACLSPAENDALSLVAVDEAGVLVASISSMAGREISAEQLAAAGARQGESLFGLDWVELALPAQPFAGEPALLAQADSALERALTAAGQPVTVHRDLQALAETLEQGAPAPPLVLVELAEEQVAGDLPERARQLAHRALSLLQGWLGAESLADSRLVILTHGAVAVRPEEELSDLAAAPLWGLIHSAQSEQPEHFVLVDLDGPQAFALVAGALNTGEGQLALREGRAFVPRLTRVKSQAGEVAPVISGKGTVLITGGLGGLGGLVAGHLALQRGADHLLLIGRSGIDSEGAPELKAELEELGTRVTVAACDVAEREQLKLLLDSIPAQYPLRAVVHAAGTGYNGMVESQTPEMVDWVLAPKLDGALNLHELTEHCELEAFVLFSSMAGTFGGPGQANYAAGNVFLDTLAAHRRARGLVATSMAWSLWRGVGLGREMGATEMRRMSGSAGFGSLSPEEGLELFDRALAVDRALVIPVPLDARVLRSEARAGLLPALLRGLAPITRRAGDTAAAGSLAQRLAATPEPEREALVLELVRGQVATVLGHASGEAIPEQRAFKELGFDSLAAVELRNRLNAATGLRLPATLVFDYPTPLALAGYLLGEVVPDDTVTGAIGNTELTRLEEVLRSRTLDDPGREEIVTRLTLLLFDLKTDDTAIDDDDLKGATVDEVFEAIHKELEEL